MYLLKYWLRIIFNQKKLRTAALNKMHFINIARLMSQNFLIKLNIKQLIELK